MACLRAQGDVAQFIFPHVNLNNEISDGDEACRLFRPFSQFETGAGKDVPKTGVFPFSRVTESVKVKMPDIEIRQFVRLHHRVGRAFDTALNP